MKDFKKSVIYQIYPKSFKDSNGDGYGDLKGITEKVLYFSQLGVDMVWISPFFRSPQKDNGYDISKYISVDPRYGTMEDLDELIQTFDKYNIELMFDMVFNHTSIEHEWFQKALKGDKYYEDFYYIRDPKEDGSLPNNWISKFGGPAWAPFGDSGKYYLCLYDKTQADLNWHNIEVRKSLYKIVNYWIDKGIKGFRFDVLNVIGKSLDLPASNGNLEDEKKLYTDTPIVHEYIMEMNKNSFGKYEDIVTVGEMSSTDIENSKLYAGENTNELSMVFSFHHLKVDYKDGEKWSDMPFDFLELKKTLNDWQYGMEKGNSWNALFLNNHDQPRANSRFGDTKNYPYETRTMLAQAIHLMRGTPYIYQGEEIGMTNPNFNSINDYNDVESINAYNELLDKGIAKEEALHLIQQKSRDNSRTPMQWTGEKYGGFSTTNPWLKPAFNYKEINVEKNLRDEKSILKYYQKLIKLRKEEKVIQDGSYQAIFEEDNNIFGYIRKYENTILVNLNNFRALEKEINLKDLLGNINDYKILIDNTERKSLKDTIILKPYEALAIIKR